MRPRELLFVTLVSLTTWLLTVSASWAGTGGMSQSPGAVPEPASLSLLGVGVAGVLVYRYRRNRRK